MSSRGSAALSGIALGTAALGLDPAISDRQARATITAALEAGVTVIDTARSYTTPDAPGRSERLTAAVVRARPGITVVSKGGSTRDRTGQFSLDGRPEALRRHVQDSLRQLGADCLDLFILHWPDPRTPIEESVGALHDLQVEGLVRAIGVSNVDLDTLSRATATVRLVAVQNRVGPGKALDTDLIARCELLGLVLLGYAPLGGNGGAALRARLADLAASTGHSPQRLILAWLRTVSPAIVPVVGARRPATIVDSAGAVTVPLDRSLRAQLDAILQPSPTSATHPRNS